jgi:hypothetical protein
MSINVYFFCCLPVVITQVIELSVVRSLLDLRVTDRGDKRLPLPDIVRSMFCSDALRIRRLRHRYAGEPEEVFQEMLGAHIDVERAR